MSVRKRGWVTRKGEAKEAWVVDFVDGAGRRQIRTFAKKKEADAFAATTKVAINAGTHVSLNNDLTVADVAAKWISQAAANGRERGTLIQYNQHADTYILPRIGALRLAKLTRGHVEAFRDGLLSGDKALSRPMAKKVFTSLKSLLKVVHCSHLADGLVVGAGRRKKQELECGKDYPTPGEIKRLLDGAEDKPRLKAWLKTAALTGLRTSELRGLRSEGRRLRGPRNSRTPARGSLGQYRANKSGKSRTVPLGDDLVRSLREWKVACPPGELGLVFPTRTGKIESHSNISRSLDQVMLGPGIVTKAGKPKYSLHALRHFFASWCINPRSRGGRELPAKLAQEWLGHSSITITLDLYGHLFPREADRDEIRESERALLG